MTLTIIQTVVLNCCSNNWIPMYWWAYPFYIACQLCVCAVAVVWLLLLLLLLYYSYLYWRFSSSVRGVHCFSIWNSTNSTNRCVYVNLSNLAANVRFLDTWNGTKVLFPLSCCYRCFLFRFIRLLVISWSFSLCCHVVYNLHTFCIFIAH